MKYILSLFLLLNTFPVAVAEEEEEKAQELSREQVQERISAAEEKHKDNPHMLRLIGQLKEGINSKYAEQEKPEQAAAPAFDASKDTASSAYSNADYDTAFKHYQALAEQGDAEAAMMLGVMYQGGLGTEKDPAAAHAWYKKSSTDGMSGSGALLERIEEDDMSLEELQAAEEYYEKISQQPAAGDAGTSANENGQTFSMTQRLPGISKPPQQRELATPDRGQPARLTPTRIESLQHPSPTTGQLQHPRPERYYRQAPAG